jgi:hypothetical protein
VCLGWHGSRLHLRSNSMHLCPLVGLRHHRLAAPVYVRHNEGRKAEYRVSVGVRGIHELGVESRPFAGGIAETRCTLPASIPARVRGSEILDQRPSLHAVGSAIEKHERSPVETRVTSADGQPSQLKPQQWIGRRGVFRVATSFRGSITAHATLEFGHKVPSSSAGRTRSGRTATPRTNRMRQPVVPRNLTSIPA